MRKLASIQTIKEVKNHPNADNIEIVVFENIGWQCVSRKGEFKAGDRAVFFEIDSLIPMKYEWIKFLQDQNHPEKPAKLKTMRFRGEISQGLALPISILPPDCVIEEGKDVTETLEITKYEPEIPACLNGIVKGARRWIPKTEEERVQASPKLIDEFQNRLVVITQKIDGTSCTIAYNDGEEDVCGREWSYNEGDNTYWKVARKYDVLRKLKEISKQTGINYGIQGEIAGPSIELNRLALKDHDLFVFNVRNINIGRYLGFYEYKEFCDRLQLQMVPILQIAKFEWKSVEELLELAKGKYVSGNHQEGIVIRPVEEFYSEVLRGRASFKAVNNDYLLEKEKRKKK
jgi:RNA ligase (TIGR02306 family)